MGNANFADCTYKKEFMDISVIVPLYNEAESLPELEAWIERVMKANGFSYEIIFVNDGSTDASWKVINDLKAKSAAVKGVCFRRNYGKSPALNVGFEPSLTKIISYENPLAFITRSIQASSSGSDSASLYSGTITDISINSFLYVQSAKLAFPIVTKKSIAVF
jgi:glycosyltransferase involved in cell wall biosynthesis